MNNNTTLLNFGSERVTELATLPPHIDALLRAHAHIKKVEKGTVLFRRNQAAAGLYGLLEGEVSFSTTSPGGRAFAFGRLPAGQWFGELAFLDDTPNPCDATTQADCVVAVVPFATVRELTASHPELLMALARVLGSRVRMLMQWAEELATLPLDTRLAKWLLTMAGDVPADAEWLHVPIVQTELACHLGVSRQSVNRLLKQWEADGWLRVSYGVVEVHDAATLRRLAQG
ncbi:Crp/Fnr family transcriptional regulator [Duganella guangzhouensis]|nr:Crp/Fnr family transcriptional regulator [Duganella guangzhouensis]